MNSNKGNLFFIIFIIIFMATVSYWYFQVRQPMAEVLTANDGIVFGQDFLSTVNKLRSVSIDTHFFTSEVFVSLKELTPHIEIPENIGRMNPFAVLQ